MFILDIKRMRLCYFKYMHRNIVFISTLVLNLEQDELSPLNSTKKNIKIFSCLKIFPQINLVYNFILSDFLSRYMFTIYRYRWRMCAFETCNITEFNISIKYFWEVCFDRIIFCINWSVSKFISFGYFEREIVLFVFNLLLVWVAILDRSTIFIQCNFYPCYSQYRT